MNAQRILAFLTEWCLARHGDNPSSRRAITPNDERTPTLSHSNAATGERGYHVDGGGEGGGAVLLVSCIAVVRVVNRKPKVVFFGRFFFVFSQPKTDF